MAPEQASGQLDQIDRRTDVYGLGAVLYEMLAGTASVHGQADDSDILKRVRTQPPKASAGAQLVITRVRFAGGLPEGAGEGRKTGTRRRLELAQDVERYLADEPVLACPEPWTQKVDAVGATAPHRRGNRRRSARYLDDRTGCRNGSGRLASETRPRYRVSKLARPLDDMYTKVAENWLEDRLDPLQKEFLEKTLAHYETFTGQAAGDPAVRLEHGRASSGWARSTESWAGWKPRTMPFAAPWRSSSLCTPPEPADREVRRALGMTNTRLGDLLVRRGQNTRPNRSTAQAAAIQRRSPRSTSPAAEDHWLLARTLKSQADLLRRQGEFSGARPVYSRPSPPSRRPARPPRRRAMFATTWPWPRMPWVSS